MSALFIYKEMILKNCDCLSPEGLKSIPNESIDLILADPPYGITPNKFDVVIPTDEMFKELNRIIKPHGAILLFGKGLFSARLMIANSKYYRYDWVWEKAAATGYLNANRLPLQAHENIHVFYKHLPTYNPQKTKGRPYTGKTHSCTSNYREIDRISTINETGERYPRSVIHNPNKDQGLHPTQKPVSLMEYFIRTYTNEGDTVLDFCMGSGSTGVAAKKLNRDFIGFEKEKDFFDIAKKRIGEA